MTVIYTFELDNKIESIKYIAERCFRITSYNVCYTKLLRYDLFDIVKNINMAEREIHIAEEKMNEMELLFNRNNFV